MNNAIPAQEAVAQFRDAMAARGIIPPENLLADDKIHRCDTAGTNGRNNGKNDASYLLHLDGIPAGGFENHQDGLGWQNWHANIRRTLTADEKAAQDARIAAAQAARKAEEAKRHEEMQKKAVALWNKATTCTSHPYIYRKGIAGAYGARVIRADIAAKILGYEPLPVRDKNGKLVHWLVLQVCDKGGVLHGLQFIDGEGKKVFLSGTRKQGCYFAIGEPEPDGVLCIAEGFATAASIREATGCAVAVAFDAGNLQPVAKALREKFPGLRLVLCADDDYHRTEGNPGITKATEAACAVGGLLAVPIFGEKRPEKATDFNDLHQHAGKEAVKRCIDAAQPVQAEDKQETASGDSVPFDVSPKGVFFIEADKDGEERTQTWICSPLYVRAKTRDNNSNAWGRLLEWRDDDQVQHQWPMPLELLQGDGSDVRRELARQGLHIATSKRARDLLAAYLQRWPVEKRARCVERLGWHGAVYVTPEQTIGQGDEIVVFQNTHAIKPAFAISGTAEEWRDSVAALASGNSRLVFALSVAFAGALVNMAGEDYAGGFHLRGASSTGKSTVLKAAASVWGNPSDYPRTWRATANGLEGLAALHNDGLLILDELSQINPKEIGEAAYLLANGQGKARATRTGAARQSAQWRLLFLSAGEESLADLMTQAGKKTNAGQEICLADIEIDAGADMGAFEALHDKPSPNAFSLAVKDAATRCHGAVGIEWLRKIVAHRPGLAKFITDRIREFMEEYVPNNADGQAQRVARRFALVATAGELATHYGLTGWKENEAIDAAQKCFAVWLEAFGTGNRVERALLEQVKAFFEAHGSSRFEPINTEQCIHNRAGFYRDVHGERQYLVLTEAFKNEVCRGFDSKWAAKVLVKAGWLEPDGNRMTQKPRIPGYGTPRCYVFTGRMWEGE